MATQQTTGQTDSLKGKLSDQIKRKPRLMLFVGLASAAGAMLLFAWLASEMLEGGTELFDERTRFLIHQTASPALTSLMRVVTMLGSVPVLLALGMIVALAFLLAGWRRGMVLFVVTMLGAVLLSTVLKMSFQRTRPIPFFDTPLPQSYSFPSGHALLSFCFYGVLAALITARLRRHAGRVIIWASAALIVAVIGFSRIYLGVHYPTDVLAGYVGALVWVMAIAIGDRLLRRGGRGSTVPP